MNARELKARAKRLTQALEACVPPMTRTELARRLTVTPGAVSHWLNGNRPCPDDTARAIAKLTGAEPGWLLNGDKKPVTPIRPVAGRIRRADLSWGFRPAPPDGGKDFGNAAVYATPMAIKTVVREDGQNSLDAGRGDEVLLRFRIVELNRGSLRYRRFLDAMRFREIASRIDAIEGAEEYESKLGTKLAAGRDTIVNDRLILLFVDDYRTGGLQGDEFDSTKAFCALVRDNLNSRKSAQTAGGVFGVGSKVNIACSRVSTVLYASKVAGEEHRGTRLVGRCELTYHEVGSGRSRMRFAGPGWFGVQGGQEGVVESAWLPDDDDLLDSLMLRRDRLPAGVRERDGTGTSILIVGFTDPQTEAGANTQQLADAFAEQAAVHFWPAMMRGTLSVVVERYLDDRDDPIMSEVVDPRAVAGVAELCDAYEKNQAGNVTPVLLAPGDVTAIGVPITIPASKGKARGARVHDETVAACMLLVRLADPDSVGSDPRLNHVAYTRGRAMITRYQPRGSSVGGRPFHAVLLAGTILGRESQQVAAEQFLRIAEPPAHDKWTFSPDLSERYVRGGKKSLDEFHARVAEELQRVLRPQSTRSSLGPEVLRKFLEIRPPRKKTPTAPTVRIARRTARIEGEAWYVEAELSVNPTPKRLVVSPRLVFRCEGSPGIPVQWLKMESTDGGTEVEGRALIVPPRTRRLTFRAWSDPSTHPAPASESSAALEVSARAEAEV